MSEESPSGHLTHLEQRAFVKVEFLRGKKAPEIYKELLEANGTGTVHRTTVSKWYTMFKEGRKSTDDAPRSGRPSTKNSPHELTNQMVVCMAMEDDRRLTVREVAAETNLCKTTVHNILVKHLQRRKICARWVPHFLSPEQKEARLRIAQTHLSRYERELDDFLDRIVTIDESWMRDFEPELKSQSNEWRSKSSPRPKKVIRQQSKTKLMMIMAYDRQGVICTQKVPQGTTVTAKFYKKFLSQYLRRKIRKSRPGMLERGVIILHDNTRPHVAEPIRQLFEDYGWEILDHPPYSPDMSPCDYDLFPKLKEGLRGYRFRGLEELTMEVTRQIRGLNRNGLLTGIQKLPDRWTKVIEKEGDYIEGL